MSRNPLRLLAGTGLALLSLAFASNAAAQSNENGFLFQVIGNSGGPAVGQCLIVGDRGYATYPTRYQWGQTQQEGTCGRADPEQFKANGQAIYRIRCVGDTNQCFVENTRMRDGQKVTKCLEANTRTNQVYFRDRPCTFVMDGRTRVHDENLWHLELSHGVTTLRPVEDGSKCLIFNNRGYEERPSLHRWNDVPNDTRYCGLGSFTALYETGQALFAWDQVY